MTVLRPTAARPRKPPDRCHSAGARQLPPIGHIATRFAVPATAACHRTMPWPPPPDRLAPYVGLPGLTEAAPADAVVYAEDPRLDRGQPDVPGAAVLRGVSAA